MRSLVRILLRPIDFLRFNVLIMSSTSSGYVGLAKKVFSEGFVVVFAFKVLD